MLSKSLKIMPSLRRVLGQQKKANLFAAVANRPFAITQEEIQQQYDVLKKQEMIRVNKNLSPRLKTSDEFNYRHLGNGEDSVSKALKACGVSSMDQLIDEVIPEDIRISPKNRFKHNGLELNGIDSESLVLQRMKQLMQTNQTYKTYIG
jgi:hypothetical protein